MAARPQRKRKPKPKSDSFETTSTVIGVAFSMPDTSILASMPEPPPIDFQARQDSISEKRRAPGNELAPKVKRTTAKPSAAKESKIEDLD
jgi:hypothetical protein